MAVATIYPEPKKAHRGKKSKAAKVSGSGNLSIQRISEARAVLRHAPDKPNLDPCGNREVGCGLQRRQRLKEDRGLLREHVCGAEGRKPLTSHRWTAHKKANGGTIFVTVTKTKNDGHFLELAIQRNAKHGLQLSLADKQDMARKIYTATPVAEQGEKKKTLAKILSVDIRTVQEWLSRTDKDNKERRDAEVFSLWLACHTQQQIAEAVGMKQTGIERVLTQSESFRFALEPNLFADIKDESKRWEAIAEHNRSHATHAADFTPPLYNVWKQQTKSEGASHFGNSEIRWLDNLLYAYTKPFDIVIDPFAGGGSTIDICKKRFRRYWVSDRKPILPRATLPPAFADRVGVGDTVVAAL